LSLSASSENLYALNNDEVKFHNGGVQYVSVVLDNGSNQIVCRVKVNLLEDAVLSFENAIHHFNITPWYFNSYCDGGLELEESNQFM